MAAAADAVVIGGGRQPNMRFVPKKAFAKADFLGLNLKSTWGEVTRLFAIHRR